MSAGLCDDVIGLMLDHFFLITPTSPASHLYVGLSTTDPGTNGAGITEPSGNGYARVTCDAWTRTGNALANTAIVDFGSASGGDWGAITHAFTIDSNGKFYLSGPLTTPRTVLDGDPAQFAAGAVAMSVSQT